jgi:hypothetical protein
MSSVEMTKWLRGEVIPAMKYFTSKSTGSFAYDDPDLQEKIKKDPNFSYGLESFSVRNDVVSERGDSIYIINKPAIINEQGRIVPV